MQTYIVLVTQTMLYDGTIRVFHMQTLENEQLTYSLFLHVAAILAKDGDLGSKSRLDFWFAEQATVGCYATTERVETGKYTIVIEQNGDTKVSHKGAVSLVENGFAVTAFERV